MVELLWFQQVPVTQTCAPPSPEGKETGCSVLTVLSNPDGEEAVLSAGSLACVLWVLGKARSLRLVVPHGASECASSSS